MSERKRLLVELKISGRRVTHGEEERARGEKLLGGLNLSISKKVVRWPATCGPLVSVGIAHRIGPGLSVVRHLI